MSEILEQVIRRIRKTEPELRRRGICHLAVFGSIARGEATPGSDIDIAVDIEPNRTFSLIRMVDTRLLLEEVLERHVDLGEIEAFRPLVRASFERDRVPVF